MIESGPAAFDGPALVAVIVTLPDVPGTIVGVDTATARSATGDAAVRVTGTSELFAGFGSMAPVVTVTAPASTGPAPTEAPIDTRSDTDVSAPTERSPATTQVIVVGPATGRLQPAGSVATVTPADGV